MKILKQQTPKTVDIIVYPGFKALEAIGPMSVFEYANLHLRHKGLGVGYDVRVASTEAGTVPSDTLMALQATKAVNTLALPDDAIIVGARDIQAALSNSQALVDWIGAVSRKIDRLAAQPTVVASEKHVRSLNDRSPGSIRFAASKSVMKNLSFRTKHSFPWRAPLFAGALSEFGYPQKTRMNPRNKLGILTQ